MKKINFILLILIGLLILNSNARGKTVQDFIQDLKSNDEKRYDKAAEYFTECEDTSIIPILIESLDDSNATVRAYMVRVLAYKKVKGAIPEIIKLLKDSNEEVRRSAAEALGDMPDNRAMSFLFKTLEDNNKWVRSFSATALGKINDKRSVPYLIKSLKDSEGEVRLSTVKALGNIGDKEAVSHLKNIMEQDTYTKIINAFLRGGKKGEKIIVYPVREAAKKVLEELKAKQKQE